jgi:hypothetical protein
MLYCIIELKETFWVIVEQLSMCIGNWDSFRETVKEEDDCMNNIMCKKIRRFPSEEFDEDFIQKMNR